MAVVAFKADYNVRGWSEVNGDLFSFLNDSLGVCPVLCSGRGDYINGQCQCNPGWKGKECSLKHDECEAPDCNGHGQCSNGKCICGRGFKGEFCDIG